MTLDPNFKPQWELLDFESSVDETLLFDSVISEATDIMGFPIEYRTLLVNREDVDDLYGEDPNIGWSEPYRTKLIYEPSNEMEVLNAFGFSSDDAITAMMMAKAVFSRDVSYDFIPKVGDVIKTLWNNKTYEIVDVGAESKIFQGKKMVWDFICRPFRHSNQSSSADDIIFNAPDDGDFPDINFEYETRPLSAYGDNDFIEEESNKIDTSAKTEIYGYDQGTYGGFDTLD